MEILERRAGGSVVAVLTAAELAQVLPPAEPWQARFVRELEQLGLDDATKAAIVRAVQQHPTQFLAEEAGGRMLTLVEWAAGLVAGTVGPPRGIGATRIRQIAAALARMGQGAPES